MSVLHEIDDLKTVTAETHANDIGEDFMEFLGYNPLLSSIDVYFVSEFVSPAFLAELKENFETKSYVSEVIYDQPLLEILDENIKKITQGIIALSTVFILIAVLLINSSIRLSVYSKRLIIKTMQLVGATKSFIRRPFIWIHLRLGILSSLIALSGLTILLFEINKRFPELNMMQHSSELSFVFGSVLLLGIGITGISAFFATQRYLNLKTDAIY